MNNDNQHNLGALLDKQPAELAAIAQSALPVPVLVVTDTDREQIVSGDNVVLASLDSMAEITTTNLCPEVQEPETVDVEAKVVDPMAELAFDPTTNLRAPKGGKPSVSETALMLATMAAMVDTDPVARQMFGSSMDFLDKKVLAPMDEAQKKAYFDKKAAELVKQREIHDHNTAVASARLRKKQERHGKGGNAKAQRKAIGHQAYLEEHAGNPVAFKLQVEGGFAFVSPNDMLTFDKPVSAAWGLHFTRIKGYPRDPEVYVKDNQFIHPSNYKVGFNDKQFVKTLYLGPRV